jgi:hypothetical protein
MEMLLWVVVMAGGRALLLELSVKRRKLGYL